VKAKNYTIKDIAREAGVSIGTVDRVLHKRGKVSAQALKKVQEVMDRIDYKPNLIARTLKSGTSVHFHVLIPNPEKDDYWKRCALGLQKASNELNAYGAQITIQPYDTSTNNAFLNSANKVLEQKTDGILVAPLYSAESMEFFNTCKDRNIPYVTINTFIEESNPVSFIGQDLRQSGKLAGRLMHLSRHHAKNVAVVHLHEDYQNSRHLTEKEKGFRDYFKNAGIRVLTIKVDQDASTDKIMHLFNGLVPDGLFITTSKTYLLEPLLRKLPKQTCVIGYDLIDQNTQLIRNGLIDFLIHQNPKQQGYIGLNYLFDYLILKKALPKKKLLPLEVIIRENMESFLT